MAIDIPSYILGKEKGEGSGGVKINTTQGTLANPWGNYNISDLIQMVDSGKGIVKLSFEALLSGSADYVSVECILNPTVPELSSMSSRMQAVFSYTFEITLNAINSWYSFNIINILYHKSLHSLMYAYETIVQVKEGSIVQSLQLAISKETPTVLTVIRWD